MNGSLRYLIPNIITFVRFILTIIFFIVILDCKIVLEVQDIITITSIFLAICITDFVDGKIARYLKATSKLGSYFDVAADFTYIVSSTILLIWFNIIPMWFIIVILVKFIDFLVTSKIINRYNIKKNNSFIFDYMGRFVAVLFYIIPFISILVNKYIGDRSEIIIFTLVYICTSFAVISFIQRFIMCIQSKGTI